MTKVQIFTSGLVVSGALAFSAQPYSLASPIDALEQLRVRANSWFKSTDKKARRKQMRAMTRALKQPCKYCHTPAFTGYTDRYMVSLQMMALSAENDVACKDCHRGKKELSAMGHISKRMQKISKQEGVSCRACHQEMSKFKSLTQRGEQYKRMHPNLLQEIQSQETATP